MNSSRFPGKPLKKINGVPMIEIIYRKVKACKFINKTIIATCDYEIKNHIKKIGGIAIMTSKKHKRASDRCAEALKKYEKLNKVTFDIIVMVQGDEPMINQKMIKQSLQPMLHDKKVQVVNLFSKIKSESEFKDKNCIKVVCDKKMNAIYFSRAPIPTKSRVKHNLQRKQICIIPFRRKFLMKYLKFKPTPLEKIESIDMMRIIEHGFDVKMVQTNFETQAVDTRSDLIKVEKMIKRASN